MSNLLFTIAIPIYNNSKTIQKTIDSCLAQETDIKYEILLVDDASTDNTPEIIAQYNDAKIRIVTLDERVPLIENHNMCLRHALGKYIIFCHADDTLEDHTIETFFHKIKSRNYPKKYIVWGHSMFKDYCYKAIYQAGFHYNEIAVGEFAPLMFLYGGLQPTGTCYSRESFLKLGGFFKVDMNASPSDKTTMIYLAMNGFRFEMIDEMVLNREYASTSGQETGKTKYFDELDDAFHYFIQNVERADITKLIGLTSILKIKPYYFYHAILQDSYHKKQIRPIIIKEIIKKPWITTNDMIHRLIKRLY